MIFAVTTGTGKCIPNFIICWMKNAYLIACLNVCLNVCLNDFCGNNGKV